MTRKSRTFTRIAASFLLLILIAAASCGKSYWDGHPEDTWSAPVIGGSYLASIDVTGPDSTGQLQTTTVNNYPIWIMVDGDGVSYWGALGSMGKNKVVIDSKIETTWTGIDGLYVTNIYHGVAVETSASMSMTTTYFTSDGAVLVGPVRTDLKFYNITGPITLPIVTPTPAAFTDVETPQLPFYDLSMAGLRPFFAPHVPVH